MSIYEVRGKCVYSYGNFIAEAANTAMAEALVSSLNCAAGGEPDKSKTTFNVEINRPGHPPFQMSGSLWAGGSPYLREDGARVYVRKTDVGPSMLCIDFPPDATQDSETVARQAMLDKIPGNDVKLSPECIESIHRRPLADKAADTRALMGGYSPQTSDEIDLTEIDMLNKHLAKRRDLIRRMNSTFASDVEYVVQTGDVTHTYKPAMTTWYTIREELSKGFSEELDNLNAELSGLFPGLSVQKVNAIASWQRGLFK